MIRNTLFSFFFFTGIIVISILFLPSLMFPQKIVLFGGKLFGYWSSFCLKFFLNTKINIKGKENIINDTKFFIASSHQSMFETFFLQTIFNSPKFILKYELLKIPVFGWYLSKIGSISVNRNKISKDNIGLIDKIKNSLVNQITKTVRWRESIDNMCNLGVKNFIELGSGNVLSGLVKRINKSVNASSIQTTDNIENFINILEA